MRGLFLIFFILPYLIVAQESQNTIGVDLNSGFSSKDEMPFWLTANRYGQIPNSNYGFANVFILNEFNEPDSNWDFAYKVSFNGLLADENLLFVNELYASARYKGLILTVGNRHDVLNWQGLSSSNGNFVKSLNARAMPGINLETNSFVKVGFWEDWFSVRANYAEYLMNDDRIVQDGVHVHNKSLHLRFQTSEKFSFNVGLNDWAQWGGYSPQYGQQPEDFKNYVRMVMGQSGNENATGSDQVNAIGNHIGNYLIELNHKGEKVNWNVYWSHPFEDRSGRELDNWPDALYGLSLDFKRTGSLVDYLVGEVTYTKHVSGSAPHYVDENGNPRAASGRDQYFLNSQYPSGWSYFGRTIGTPYIITELDENGIPTGPDLSYNRFLAINIGTKGYLNKVSYRALLSYVQYYAWFEESFESTPRQYSGFAEFDFTELLNWNVGVELGASFDIGDRLPDNFGGFLRIYKDFRL